MSQAALMRIQSLRNDDLFLNFDADEIPKTEVIHYWTILAYPVQISLFKFFTYSQTPLLYLSARDGAARIFLPSYATAL